MMNLEPTALKIETLTSPDRLKEAYELLGNIFGEVGYRRDLTAYEKIIHDYPELSVYATVNGDIAGAILASVSNHQIAIHEVAVDPKYHRQKIGSQLMQKLEQNARQLKISKIELGGQLDAVSFYEANGFTANLFMQAKIPPTLEEVTEEISDFPILKATTDTENNGEPWFRVLVKTKNRHMDLEKRIRTKFSDIYLLYVCTKELEV